MTNNGNHTHEYGTDYMHTLTHSHDNADTSHVHWELDSNQRIKSERTEFFPRVTFSDAADARLVADILLDRWTETSDQRTLTIALAARQEWARLNAEKSADS